MECAVIFAAFGLGLRLSLTGGRLTIVIKTCLRVNPMKAILHCEYGGPEVLKVEDVEKPVPNDNQSWSKFAPLHSIHSISPFAARLLFRPLFGLRKPKDTRLGVDYAGTVEAVGKNVTQFKPGDEVFGGKNGAFAEYCVSWPIERSF